MTVVINLVEIRTISFADSQVHPLRSCTLMKNQITSFGKAIVLHVVAVVCNSRLTRHKSQDSKMDCKPGKVEPAYIECGNSATAMQVS